MTSNRLIAVLAALSAIGANADVAMSSAPKQCVVPRLFALTLPAAKARLAASGCRVGVIAIEVPSAVRARVASQVPAPGAVLPRGSRVALGVS